MTKLTSDTYVLLNDCRTHVPVDSRYALAGKKSKLRFVN